MKPCGILETALYVRDLATAERFYTTVLRLDVIARAPGRHVFFRCGGGVLLVFNPDRTEAEETLVGGVSVPRHGARGPGHMAFAVREAEVEPWRARLQAAGVAIESEIRWPGGGHSLYFRDPAGNSVELATPRLWGLPEQPLT
jgi:catechol 2,3-dioxygenase-like lactoylglutathione lyase family enzyme